LFNPSQISRYLENIHRLQYDVFNHELLLIQTKICLV